MKRIAALILLAGCAATQAPLPAPQDDTCDAARYEYLIGQDATALERVLILGKVRVIRPGQPVTQDYLNGRINFTVADDGTIARITCG